MAVRTGVVLRGEELQLGETKAEHGAFRLGVERGRQGADHANSTAESMPWGILFVTRRAIQVSGGAVGWRDMRSHVPR